MKAVPVEAITIVVVSSEHVSWTVAQGCIAREAENASMMIPQNVMPNRRHAMNADLEAVLRVEDIPRPTSVATDLVTDGKLLAFF